MKHIHASFDVPVLVDKENRTLQQKSSQSLVIKKKVMGNDIRLGRE